VSAQLKKEHQELATLNTNLNNYFTDEIEKHLAKDEVLELQKREPKYKEFSAEIARLEYQGNINLRTLWKHFWAAIPWVPLNQVFALSEDSINLFSQLKLISVQSRLHILQTTDGGEEVKEGDAANNEQIIQQIIACENSSLDSLFV
jgi:hypothetical protein